VTLETILFQNQVLPLNLTLNKFLGNLQTLRTFVRFILAQSGFRMAIVISARRREESDRDVQADNRDVPQGKR
jgi:hypothetical protein